MWYGGHYRECFRKQQAQTCYAIITELKLTKEDTFKDIKNRLKSSPIIIARIRHLLHNEDFGRIMEDE